MNKAGRSFIICAAIVALAATTIHAQDDRERTEADMTRLQVEVERGQEFLATKFFDDPAVEAIAVRYESSTRASFAIIVNKRAQLREESKALLKTLVKLDTALFGTVNGMNFTIEPDFVGTEPLKSFGVQIGGSTSNKAGCFEGTIGAAVTDRNDHERKGFLTCNHVAAAEGPLLCPNATKAKEVVPATAKTGCHADEIAGRLVEAYRIGLAPADRNLVDAAFVEAKDVLADDCPIPLNSDFYRRAALIPWKLPVRKCGAGSNYTENGVVRWHDALVRVAFMPCGPTITFAHQIVVKGEGFATAGDSGAAVRNKDGKAVGMIFAGDESEWTFLNPIDKVLDLLQVDLRK